MARKRRTSVRSNKRRSNSNNGWLGLLLIIIAVCLGYEPVNNALKSKGIHLSLPVAEKVQTPIVEAADALELPAPLKDRPEKLLKRRTYTVSYNRDLRVPNWVAWELNRDRLVERESRTDKFLPDPDLPEREAVTTDDYKRSGWDRGHMCPAADNRWHWRAMQESFYMTNICPQHHNLNRGDWKELEDDCRVWVEKYGRIYIACGPIFYKGKPRTIGREHKVAVPDAFFKVILCADSRPPRAIGFIYKNTSGNHPLDHYVNSVDQVERITGIDFFPALPDEVEKKVEANYDLKLWR